MVLSKTTRSRLTHGRNNPYNSTAEELTISLDSIVHPMQGMSRKGNDPEIQGRSGDFTFQCELLSLAPINASFRYSLPQWTPQSHHAASLIPIPRPHTSATPTPFPSLHLRRSQEICLNRIARILSLPSLFTTASTRILSRTMAHQAGKDGTMPLHPAIRFSGCYYYSVGS